MHRHALSLAIAFVALAASFTSDDVGSGAAIAGPSPKASSAVVAIIATEPGAEQSSLYLAPLGSSTRPSPVATMNHAPDAIVRARVLPGTSTVLAVVDTSEERDLSFAASLVRLVPHLPPETLCSGVVHASRPLVTPSGRVFVARGSAGIEPVSAAQGLRIDALAIDEIDPATGAARTIHTFSGQLTFLAGFAKGEVLVYRIGPAIADVVGIDPDSGAVRTIAASVLPFARDFSVDEGESSLVLEERSETNSGRWVVDRMHLSDGARTRLYEGSRYALSPHAWPGGGVAYDPDTGGGLALIGGASFGAPLGDGVDVVEDVASNGSAALLLHTTDRKFPVAFGITTADHQAHAIPAPPDTRITIAGFVGGAP